MCLFCILGNSDYTHTLYIHWSCFLAQTMGARRSSCELPWSDQCLPVSPKSTSWMKSRSERESEISLDSELIFLSGYSKQSPRGGGNFHNEISQVKGYLSKVSHSLVRHKSPSETSWRWASESSHEKSHHQKLGGGGGGYFVFLSTQKPTMIFLWVYG